MPRLARAPSLEDIAAERHRRQITRQRAAEHERIARDGDAIRKRCETLSGFFREAWHVLEPNAQLIPGWHIDAICEHLQAVTEGQINRLAMTVPPGSTKSLLTSVAWQAFEWGPCALRSMRYLSTGYSEIAVKRDTRKTRDLIMSEWYRQLWPEVELSRVGETSFANTDTGTREGSPFGSLTAQRADRLVIDDPHSIETAESVADRNTTTRKFREGAQNRLNDQEKSAIALIMQRLHGDDTIGVIEQYGMDYVRLMIPMEFEIERRCVTKIGWRDPRKVDGEIMDPVRFPPETIAKLKRDMGAHAWASQYMQRPSPREGGMFKREFFTGKIVKVAPSGLKRVRGWDLAASAKNTSSRTSGVLMSGPDRDGNFYVEDCIATQREGHKVRKIVRGIAETDGKGVEISVPQDPGAAGKVVARDYVTMLAGWVIHATPESGDKVSRAEPFAVQCEAGNVYLVEGPWNAEYVTELCEFPGGHFKDRVDASSRAFARLLQLMGRDEGVAGPMVVKGAGR